MLGERRWRDWGIKAAIAAAFYTASAALDDHHNPISKPQYHYGAKIPVTCLNRSMYVVQFIKLPISNLKAH
jgi:hypothetical protein